MTKFPIYKNLATLNGLPRVEAEAAFRDCCGSDEWARKMAAARPFRLVEDLFEKANQTWDMVSQADRLEAFAAHPKIGDKRPAPKQQKTGAKWSADEQAGVGEAGDDVREALAEANRLYEEKFGFIFIVCATGKSAAEMLAICKARLGNSVKTELSIAAEEQRKITELRLIKLIEG